jgi:hypothetical protein
MGLMSKLFGKGEQDHAAEPAEQAVCPHTTMTPRWDSVDDIGKYDRATSFRCESCGNVFSREEANELRSSEADRLRDAVPTEATSNP